MNILSYLRLGTFIFIFRKIKIGSVFHTIITFIRSIVSLIPRVVKARSLCDFCTKESKEKFKIFQRVIIYIDKILYNKLLVHRIIHIVCHSQTMNKYSPFQEHRCLRM